MEYKANILSFTVVSIHIYNASTPSHLAKLDNICRYEEYFD